MKSWLKNELLFKVNYYLVLSLFYIYIYIREIILFQHLLIYIQSKVELK